MESVYLNVQIDCESTQRSVADPELGRRSITGLGDILAKTGMKATFAVIPTDLRVHASVYRQLEADGHEIGLHVHPSEMGYEEFLGVYGHVEQVHILARARDDFAEIFGRVPETFTPGYASANDHTFAVLEEVGLRQGMVSIPTRNLPNCACVWGDSPLDAHYPHRHNRCLVGDVDFVDVPMTVDPTSRLWGGGHPQDLRVELTDAKNHFYTIQKSLKRQFDVGAKIPVKYIKILTHNIFDYAESTNFRRETLFGMIAAAKRLCDEQNSCLVPATTAEIAAEYRRKVPLPSGGQKLTLDVRGRAGQPKEE